MPNNKPVQVTEKYDLIVLGSGPGGQRAAVQAAKLKKRVLVIEKDEIGGNCLHQGTIPSKTLREVALRRSPSQNNSIRDAMAQSRLTIQGEANVIRDQLHRNGVEFLKGTGYFVSDREIAVRLGSRTQTFHAKFIVIAAGSRPTRPDTIPFDDLTVFDSETILGIEQMPRAMAIIGAGVIGCEYASFFARLGIKVTLIDRRLTLLRSVDQETVHILQKHFIDHHIRLFLGCQETGIERGRDPHWPVTIHIGEESLHADALLYCMGREGNVEGLNLPGAGLAANARKLIEVNAHYQTAVPHIYAVGDIIGPPALAASSAEQGRLAACHAFGIDGGAFSSAFPYGIYTIPEISSSGAQEEELEKKKIPYVVGRAQYAELARGKIIGDQSGYLKLLVGREDRKILGIHIIGTGATELIHIGQVAMALGAKVDFLVSNVFNYPTLAEAYKVAAYHAFNQLREAQ